MRRRGIEYFKEGDQVLLSRPFEDGEEIDGVRCYSHMNSDEIGIVCYQGDFDVTVKFPDCGSWFYPVSTLKLVSLG